VVGGGLCVGRWRLVGWFYVSITQQKGTNERRTASTKFPEPTESSSDPTRRSDSRPLIYRAPPVGIARALISAQAVVVCRFGQFRDIPISPFEEKEKYKLFKSRSKISPPSQRQDTESTLESIVCVSC
jgi:hypothetical protein